MIRFILCDLYCDFYLSYTLSIWCPQDHIFSQQWRHSWGEGSIHHVRLQIEDIMSINWNYCSDMNMFVEYMHRFVVTPECWVIDASYHLWMLVTHALLLSHNVMMNSSSKEWSQKGVTASRTNSLSGTDEWTIEYDHININIIDPIDFSTHS